MLTPMTWNVLLSQLDGVIAIATADPASTKTPHWIVTKVAGNFAQLREKLEPRTGTQQDVEEICSALTAAFRFVSDNAEVNDSDPLIAAMLNLKEHCAGLAAKQSVSGGR